MLSAGAIRHMNKAMQRQARFGQLKEQQVDKGQFRDEFGFVMTDADYATLTGTLAENEKGRTAGLDKLSGAQTMLDKMKLTSQTTPDAVWNNAQKDFVTIKMNVPEGAESAYEKTYGGHVKEGYIPPWYKEGDSQYDASTQTFQLPKAVIDYFHKKNWKEGKAMGVAGHMYNFTGDWDADGNYVFDVAKEERDMPTTYGFAAAHKMMDGLWATTKKSYMKKIAAQVKEQNVESKIKTDQYQDQIAQGKAAIAAAEAGDTESLAAARENYAKWIGAARKTAEQLVTKNQ